MRLFLSVSCLTHLALNQAMVNWDTYGRMTHNYYLYSDPSDDRFTWIPWDLNEAILERNGGIRTLIMTSNNVGRATARTLKQALVAGNNEAGRVLFEVEV